MSARTADRSPVKSWESWLEFVRAQGLENITAAEYYELGLPSPDTDPHSRKAEVEKLADELLKDFVATGALQLPACANIEKLRVHLDYQGRMLLRKRKKLTASNPRAEDGEVLIWTTEHYLHDHLKMTGAAMEEVLERYRCAVLNTYG